MVQKRSMSPPVFSLSRNSINRRETFRLTGGRVFVLSVRLGIAAAMIGSIGIGRDGISRALRQSHNEHKERVAPPFAAVPSEVPNERVETEDLRERAEDGWVQGRVEKIPEG